MRGRWIAAPLFLGAGYLATVACSAPQKGALVLAVSTDMQTPKDISVISIFITTDSVVKFDYLGRVLPDGTVSLPATLSIVEPDTQGAPVRIRVIAFQEQKARVLRDVLTTVPHERTALLRVPLNFLDDGSGQGSLDPTLVPSAANGVPDGQTTFDPDTVASKCDFSQEQTSVDGVCVDAHVDSTTLPDYADTEVYGTGGSQSSSACFDVTTCFAPAQPVTGLDTGTCSFPLPAGANAADLNIALVTGSTGDCLQSGRCYVPLENDPAEGWSVSGSTVELVTPICSLLAAGAQLFVSENACPAKVESTPVCEPTGGGGDGGTCSGTVTVTCPSAGVCSGPSANCGPNSCNNPPQIQLDITGSTATIDVGGKDGGVVTAQGQVKDPASCTVYFPGLPVGCNSGPIDVTIDLQSGQLTGTGSIGGGSSDTGDGSTSSCSGTATCTFSQCTVAYGSVVTDGGGGGGPGDCQDGPPPPASATRSVSLSFASVDFAGATPSSWSSIGYNLDGLCTTASSTDVCTQAQGASKSEQTDGPGGIDNSYGANICPIETSIGAGDCSTSITNAFLLTDATGSGTLGLYSGNQWMEYPIADAYVVNNGGSGTVAGVLPVAGVVAAVQAEAGRISQSLCSGSSFQSIANQLEEAADIMHDGSNGPGQACDAISFGMNFTGASSFSGSIPAVNDPCAAEAGADAGLAPDGAPIH
jgi:hypothetical protein